jgi:two-component sensor histidine kinase
LIVNELITNALKYAFPGERTGEVKVVLRRTGRDVSDKGEYELMVRDNGVGIPQEVDLEETKTLGLHLVSTLVEHQLRGSIDLNREEGTQYCIRFNEVRYKKRI